MRALTLAFMNSCGNAVTLLIQQFLYPTTDAPEYKKGFPASLAFVCGMAVWAFVVRYFELRTLNTKTIDSEDGGSGIIEHVTEHGGKQGGKVNVTKE